MGPLQAKKKETERNTKMDTHTIEDKKALATVAMARGIRNIAKAMTSLTYGEDYDIIDTRLDEAIHLIEEAKSTIWDQTFETGDADPEPVVHEAVITEDNGQFPDDAPEAGEGQELTLAPANKDADDTEEDANDEVGDAVEILATETEDAPLPDTLVEASKKIYQAAKFINKELDNRRVIDPNAREIADITYRLAEWLQGQEDGGDPHDTRSRSARHLRHIARFIAKGRRRNDFHYVRKVRKFRG